MRIGGACVGSLLALCVFAQTPPQSQISPGVFVEADSKAEGELSLRDAENEVFLFRFDARTHVTRMGENSSISQLRSGERVEISSEPLPDSPLRYAVSITALDPQSIRRSSTSAR